jgi:hypothetical protein
LHEDLSFGRSFFEIPAEPRFLQEVGSKFPENLEDSSANRPIRQENVLSWCKPAASAATRLLGLQLAFLDCNSPSWAVTRLLALQIGFFDCKPASWAAARQLLLQTADLRRKAPKAARALANETTSPAPLAATSRPARRSPLRRRGRSRLPAAWPRRGTCAAAYPACARGGDRPRLRPGAGCSPARHRRGR